MKVLEGFQKKYLRGVAHSLKPLIYIGQKGMNDAVARAVKDALLQHELIKVKFNEFKEKENKQKISRTIEKMTDSQMVGLIGHTAIFYRQHPDPEKRNIAVPER